MFTRKVFSIAVLSHGVHLLMLLLLLIKTVQARQTVTCAHSYDLRMDNSCMYSSQDGYTLCTDLTTYLESFNDVLDSSNCLNLTLEPGVYELSKAATLTYDIIISSTVYQNVVISCSAANYPSIHFTSSLNTRGRISLEGIFFRGCNKPLQFDELAFVSMDNCSFRYVKCDQTTVLLLICYVAFVLQQIYGVSSRSVQCRQYRD